MHELDRAAFDPALFIDDDGKVYMATSIGSDGTITLLTLNDELTAVTSAQKIHYIKGAEGSKLIKREGWYYLFNAIPRRLGLTVSRARSLTGPWETRDQIDDKTGGHQGALVDLPGGGWYGFVMLDAGAIGRVTNISPIFWQDDWPVWGTPDAPGRVPATAAKPILGKPFVERPVRRLWQADPRTPMAMEPQSRRPPLVAQRAPRLSAAQGDPGGGVLERAQYAGAEGAGAQEPGRGQGRRARPRR